MAINRDNPFPEDTTTDIIGEGVNNKKDLIEEEKTELTDDYTQVAMLGGVKTLAKKGTQVLSDVGKKVDDFLLKDPEPKKNKAGEIVEPAKPNVNKPKVFKEKKPDEGDPPLEGDPLAKVDDEGNVFVRPAKTEELQLLSEFAFKNPDDIKDADIKLLNMGKFETGYKESGNLDTALKSMMVEVYKLYKDEKLDGKKIRIEPRKLTKVLENEDGTKTFVKEGGVTFKEMLNDAQKIGSTRAFINLLQRKPGDRPLSYAESIAARKVLMSFQLMAHKLLRDYKKDGNVVTLAKLQQAIGLMGYASISLAGNEADLARALVSQRLIVSQSKAGKNHMRDLMNDHLVGVDGDGNPIKTMIPQDGTFIINEKNAVQFLEQNGGVTNAKILAEKFSRLPQDGSQTAFTKGWLMHAGSVTSRALVELYQTTLLSSISTHAFNTAGQLTFMGMMPLERMMAGRFGEAFAMYKAVPQYFTQAVKGMAFALKNERSMVDNVSKLDVDQRSISGSAFGLHKKGFGDLGNSTETAMSYVIDYFGVMMRMAGYRPMLAIDEFFKGMARGMEMEAIAFRKKSETFKDLMNQYDKNPSEYKKSDGKVATDYFDALADAKQQALTKYYTARGDRETFDEASGFARMITFQDDLPESFATFGRIINNPVMKIWIPFYKTPTQIVRRIFERSSILAPFLVKEVRDNLRKGGVHRRQAIATALGPSSIFALGMYHAAGGATGDEQDKPDYYITGYGPSDPKVRQTWLESNVPYSIAIKDDDGGYTFVSYARYDPYSGVLAMMADAKDVIYNSEDEVDITSLILAGGFASAKYVGTALPMTQFIGELTRVMGGNYESTQQKIDRIVKLVGGQVIEAGTMVGEHIQAVGVYNPYTGKATPQLSGNFERMYEPGQSNTTPQDMYPEGNMFKQEMTRNYYKALNQICAKTPSCSPSLPSRKNRWYEELPKTPTRGWVNTLPFRVIKHPAKKQINQELEKLGYGLPYMSMNPEPMIKLNNEQQDRYIELYNYPDRSPRAKEVFGSDIIPGVNEIPMPLLDAMHLLIKSDEYNYEFLRSTGTKIPASKKHKADMLDELHYDYKKYAFKLLQYEYPDITALKQQRDVFIENNIKKPRVLNSPTGEETLKANQDNLREMFPERRF